MDCSHTHSRWQPQVRVAYDYYPFGLTWHNPAAADTPEGRHDHAYQDKEFQWNEFGAGAGMALYDFHARMYDPATATWSVPDPAEQFSNPYLAMGNNPVANVDPDGRFINEFFDALEYFSPIVIRPEFHLGSQSRGIGFGISIGRPKLIPVSLRWEYGKTYYWKKFGNPKGWETKRGGEITYLWFFSMTGTEYDSGETSQRTSTFTIGSPFFNIKYENDYQPDFVHKITPK